MAAIAQFQGGPLAGVSEALRVCPAELVFSSGTIGGEWDDGPVAVADVRYARLEPFGGVVDPETWMPVVRYAWQP